MSYIISAIGRIMSSNILVGACITLGLLGTWNTWTLYQVNQRLDVMEESVTAVSKNNLGSPSSTTKTVSSYQLQSSLVDIQRKARSNDASNNGGTEQIPVQRETAIDLTDPEIQKTIAQIAETNAKRKEEELRQSKMEAYKTSIQFELENFSNEKGYDMETIQNIGTILDDSSDEWRAVRDQVREGEISWIDARTEFKSIGDETKDKITEQISDEDYNELRSRLWGDWAQ